MAKRGRPSKKVAQVNANFEVNMKLVKDLEMVIGVRKVRLEY